MVARFSPLVRVAVALFTLSTVSFAAPSTGNPTNRLKESIPPPRGWTQGPRAPPHFTIDLSIALPQPKFKQLEAHLYEISDPSHARYGQHLSKGDVDALVVPHAESLGLVDAWLAEHGISEEDKVRSDGKDWVTVRVSVALAEKMLDTKYHIWTHEASGDAAVRTLSYSVPESVHDHVDLIQPTTLFARFAPQKTDLHYFDGGLFKPVGGLPNPISSTLSGSGKGAVNASCNAVVTLECLQDLYGTKGYKPSGIKKGNQIGITGYLEQFANLADLREFYEQQLSEAVNSSFTFIPVNGGQNSQNLSAAGIEADLDTQYGLGLTFPTPGTFWSTGGRPPFLPDLDTPTNTNEPYNDWLSFVLAQKELPQTITTSYGDEEQTVPFSYADRACKGFAQLGARGVSVIFSSGDGGVGDGNEDPATTTCKTNDGRNVTEFLPFFPAGCPYVTTVGGTVMVEPEVGVFFSGGGFSNYFERPSYQAAAVETYLDKHLGNTYAGLFNRSGRASFFAYPDVSAQSNNFSIVNAGRTGLVGGTSAAAPTFAAIVTLLNDVRLSLGLPSLGFLNPFLYSRGVGGLTDILSGNNPGCGTPGFSAAQGWDPVTGLGTPKFQVLKGLVL